MTRFRISPLAALCMMSFASLGTHAATFDLGGDASFSIGAGLRLSYESVEDAAPNGDRSNDFVVNSTRVYMSGRVMKTLGATLNFERDGSGNTPDGLRVMDAYVQYEPMPEFNIWFGRMLPASDRANLDGPFYLNVWDYPGAVSQYPNLAIGRDNGVQVWGKLMDNKLTYVAGAFKGHNNVAGGSNQSDKLLYAGRLAYAFWEAEPAPAYYTGSTYYGKDILTVGIAGMFQSDGVGVAGASADYTGMNIDVLMEKKLAGGGLLTLEGAYYDYDLDGIADCGSGEPGSPVCPAAGPNDNVGGLVEGKGYLATAAFLFPSKIGIGQLQPFVRYQSFDRELSNSNIDVLDVGFNYVIKGHNARVSAFWSKTEDDRPAPDTDVDKFVIGVQFQI
ncbi:MAG: OprO/OprP family phosphate-selective porin [Thiobacillus sp.]|nr:OprO/OprP family phosphate-selective porin [Thiobacillus sp.]